MKSQPLTPKEAVQYLLSEYNLAYSHRYLAKKRCIGGGPGYFKIGNRVFYEKRDINSWIVAHKTKTVLSTSQMPESIEEPFLVENVWGEYCEIDFNEERGFGYVYMN